ncbi:cytochrome b5 domain-containing protein [Clostridium sp.]|uniref:cytochrome b5 domain-containing protein n=1 Tax=Clostridium sp. TaxID=1506 RepID=UPI002FCA1DF3
MDLETSIKKMYGYFTEVNKKVSLIQWQYRRSSVMRGYIEEHEGVTATPPETTGVPMENTEALPEERVFTLEELKQYNGSNNNPAYVAVDGIVYDVTNIARWAGGSHFGVRAGTDSTQEYHQCHGLTGAVNKLPKIGVLQTQEG